MRRYPITAILSVLNVLVLLSMLGEWDSLFSFCRNPRPRFWLLHRRRSRIARILFGKPVDCIPIVLQYVRRTRSSRLFAAGHGILPIGIQAVFYRLTDGFSGSLKMHKRLLPIFIWGIFLRHAFF